MDQPLFSVGDFFSIGGRGVVVCTDIPMTRDELKLQVADPIELMRTDGTRLRTSIRSVESFNTPGGAHRGLAILLGPEVKQAEIEVGATV